MCQNAYTHDISQKSHGGYDGNQNTLYDKSRHGESLGVWYNFRLTGIHCDGLRVCYFKVKFQSCKYSKTDIIGYFNVHLMCIRVDEFVFKCMSLITYTEQKF